MKNQFFLMLPSERMRADNCKGWGWKRMIFRIDIEEKSKGGWSKAKWARGWLDEGLRSREIEREREAKREKEIWKE